VSPPPEEIEFERGIAAIREKHLADAERCFTRALRAKPGWHEALQRRAFVREALGRLRSAMSDYCRSLAGNPRCKWCLEGAADACSKLGDPASALRYLDRAVRVDPRNDSFINDRGGVRFQLGNYRGAIRDFTRVASDRRSIRRMLALQERGRARALIGQMKAARLDLDRAVRMRPNAGENRCVRGLVRLLANDTRGALEDLRAARGPRDLMAQIERAPARAIIRARKMLADAI